MASKIVYRVVAALIALCSFPVALFSPIVRVVGENSATGKEHSAIRAATTL